jgi:CRP-like cAMP-binding protein/1-acyl-sn-glycerol-3-phosphate acyltransferase
VASIGVQDRDDVLDQLAQSRAWAELGPARLIPLLESAELKTLSAGDTLFEQHHPAKSFYLLVSGAAIQLTKSASGTEMAQVGTIDWAYAALGWSGFLPPHRYGSTVVARESLQVLTWTYDALSGFFYGDPGLSVRFLETVLSSVSRQFRQLRSLRIDAATILAEPPQAEPPADPRPVVGRADSAMRRSAFFAAFDEAAIDAFAMGAVLESWQPGSIMARQDDPSDGLLLLASGRCNSFFEHDSAGQELVPFRRFHHRYGIVAGIPGAAGRYVAEASVIAESHCWTYRLPRALIDEIVSDDPEFGRAFQQRLLVRFAGLLGALQVARQQSEPERDVIANTLAVNRARLPVTSELYKVPHLLAHRLTLGNALAVLKKVAETGRYHERMLAASCRVLLSDLAAENAFYQEILEACESVSSSDESTPAYEVRENCDRAIDEAFRYLDCRVSGLEKLPAAGGNIFILNHLACPEYYKLPNHFHFSFDTAFVSRIVWRHYGQSAIRVVRESPDAEFGHNLFYRRLGHITVPTIESGMEGSSEEQFRAMRRAAGEAFTRRGREALESGMNLVICPEGQSQPPELSPSRFHTGAFRLALEAGAPVVPVALAGFHRRFKDGPLVGIVGSPVDVGQFMKARSLDSVRSFADALRSEFAEQVAAAAEVAAGPPRLTNLAATGLGGGGRAIE